MNRTTIDDRYVLSRPLGSGGMAEVFLAHDEVLDRDVALKVLRGQYASDEEFAERFRREARSAASLSHPNIVQVYDRGEAPDGTSYIAMEYVSGGTLKERLDERGPLEPDRALAVVAQIAEALRAAHERGVIHRDIKPQNVLVTELGHLKVTDFGIARAASSVTISATNAVFGTAAYLSPEQALGQPATPKSDLYSLGIVLYELLTGTVPYTADNPVVVCMKHVTEPLRPPRKIDPLIPSVVNDLVVALLAKDPADRPGNASELLYDLDLTRAGIAPTPRPPARAPATAVTRAAAASNAATANAATANAATGNVTRTAPTARRFRTFRRRGLLLLAGVLAVLILIGAATLVFFANADGAGPLDPVRNVSDGGLDAPANPADPAAGPPPPSASPPSDGGDPDGGDPDGVGPDGSQYDSAG